ncbi:hypothetical protein [Tunicatimonas pelagia]|uniref:hypothetical protein n=1 Tax=Tunicatimonas pelagia TaxID=931531 RepID=UPI0026661BE7|nr:hypothetical protein [Tunicatimonas pelagia]WKN44733.1 hypothetical protein P0M28_07115 [Tunicatimonas pelagia]
MSEEDRNLLAQGDSDFWYSDYLKENTDLFILQDSGMYTLNTYSSQADLLTFLNRDFVYKVGDEIRVYQEGAFKTILDGDDEKIKLLGGIDENNEELRISVAKHAVLPFKDIAANGRQEVEIFADKYGSTVNTCGHSVGSRRKQDRVHAEIYVNRWTVTNQFTKEKYYKYVLEVELINWRKDGLFGGWTRKRTHSLKLLGNLDVLVETGNFWGDSYSGSYDVDINTGGRLMARIRTSMDLIDDVTGTLEPEFYAGGILNAYGRGGTRCGDIGTDNDCRDGCDIWN